MAVKKSTSEALLVGPALDVTPLAFMLQVLRDPKSTFEQRQWAASAAAPYCHAELASFDHTGEVILRHDDVDDD